MISMKHVLLSLVCVVLSGCAHSTYSQALDGLPIMPHATDIEKKIQSLNIPDAGDHASISYHVNASWRDVMSFYEKELIALGWQELVWQGPNDTEPRGRFRKYQKNSILLSVDTHPGLAEIPDKVEDQKVLLYANYISSMNDKEPYFGHQFYVPETPGSTEEEAPPIDPLAWTSWDLNRDGLTLPLPPEWTYAAGIRSDGGINLLDKKTSSIVATLYCPIPQTGFEAWDFKIQSSTFQQGGRLKGKTLWIGTSRPGAGVGNLNLLFIHRNSFDHWYDGDDADFSCMVTASDHKDILQGMYNRIP